MNIELVSVHVPKTAGTSFCHALKIVYGEEAIFMDNGEYAYTDLKDMPLQPQHQVIHGHLWAGKYMSSLPQARHIAWLRHPVDWLISLYGFLDLLGPNANPAWKYLNTERPSLLDFAASDSVHAQSQGRFLSGVAVDSFFFLGICEHFAEDLREFLKMIDQPPMVPPTENVNPGITAFRAEVWANSGLVADLCDCLKEDMGLYEVAVKKRLRRLDDSEGMV